LNNYFQSPEPVDTSNEEEKLLKMMKTRFNFASMHGGAKILGTNAGCISAKALLDENKDTYMINECDMEEKWAIISLSEDILVDMVILVNLEYYSSNLKEFEILTTTHYPSEEWLSLGKFVAKDSHSWQAFKVKPTWARYIKLNLLTHYSGDLYCTLSQVRVFGTTMLEGFRQDFESAADDLLLETNTTEKEIESKASSNSATFEFYPPHRFDIDEITSGENLEDFYSYIIGNSQCPSDTENEEREAAASKSSRNQVKNQDQDSNTDFKYLNSINVCGNIFFSHSDQTMTQLQCPIPKQLPAAQRSLTELMKANSDALNKSTPYESIFRTLTRRIKILELNQLYYQNHFALQETFKLELQQAQEENKNMIKELNKTQKAQEAAFNRLKRKFEQATKKNDELQVKILQLDKKLASMLDCLQKGFYVMGVVMFLYILYKSFDFGDKKAAPSSNPELEDSSPLEQKLDLIRGAINQLRYKFTTKRSPTTVCSTVSTSSIDSGHEDDCLELQKKKVKGKSKSVKNLFMDKL